MLEPFPVRVVVWIESGELSERLKATDAFRIPDAPIIDGCGSFEFTVEFANHAEEVTSLIATRRRGTSAFVIVSDRLVSDRGSAYEPTRFAADLRDWFNHEDQRGCVGGLLGLVDGPWRRTNDIAGMVDIRRDMLAEMMRKELQRISDGLWLKSPVRVFEVRDDSDAICVRLADSRDEMQRACELRFQVYSALGYLDPEVSECGDERASRGKPAIEVDQFDKSAVHLVAIDRQSDSVIGAVRLITKVEASDAPVLESVGAIQQQQAAWLASLLADERLLHTRYEGHPSTPFPVMENSDFEDRWPDFLSKFPADEGGELSRLVVSPRYRGLGVSTLLIRMITALAVDMRKEYVILECVPQHLSMYERHGFTSLAGHHCRAQDLDQLAVGMTMCLAPAPFNEPLGLAGKDLKMLKHTSSGGGILCLCRATSCWEQGLFLERGKDVCPLRDEILPLRRLFPA